MSQRKPLKSNDIAFVRVRLMTKSEGECAEWICAQVDATGRDLGENVGVVWALESSIITVQEAREVVQRKNK